MDTFWKAIAKVVVVTLTQCAALAFRKKISDNNGWDQFCI